MAEAHQEITNPFKEALNAIGSALNSTFERVFEKKQCWILLHFDTDSKRTNYISNVERESAVCAMKEFIARAEGRIHEADTVQ